MLIQLLSQHPQAAGTIVANTPVWVWGLLAGLVALGLSQWRGRRASLTRVTVMPVMMTAFSVYGVVSAFGAAGQLPVVVGLWAVGAALTLALAGRLPAAAGSRYDAATRQFELPGSAVPLMLILGIFFTKYLVGVELSLQASQAQTLSFAAPISLLYGVFSGVFAARTLALLRLRQAPARLQPQMA